MNWREEQGGGGIHAPRRSIGWVPSAFDVTRLDGRAQVFQEGVNALEDVVDSVVPAATSAPTGDDALIVTIHSEVPTIARITEEGADEKFEGNSLKPSNVPNGPPAGEEAPRPPSSLDDDRKTHSRGGIGVGLSILDRDRSGDGTGGATG